MSLRHAIENAPANDDRWIWGKNQSLDLTRFRDQSCLDGKRDALAGKSILIHTADQIEAAAALIELDGIAARMLACPPGIKPDHLATVAAEAEIDVIVSAGAPPAAAALTTDNIVPCRLPPTPAQAKPTAERETEWLLLTSGTTGAPKIVRHTLRSLTGAIKPSKPGTPPTWSTFYDIRRYGGLQIFLRAMLGGGSLVLSDADEPVADFLDRLAAHGVTHMSGTPSHWRRALMNPRIEVFKPSYVRLSGEISDQTILDDLKEAFPQATIDHAYASTEAGVGFVVSDGREGFPAALLGASGGNVEMKIVDNTLRLRSVLTSAGFLGKSAPALRDSDGFVDTGDIVERRNDRYYFVGRRGGIINVGGLKVHPEEVESVINRHHAVHMSRVKSRKNPFTGAVIIADVVLKAGEKADDDEQLRAEILSECREALPQYKVPALLRFVPSLELTEAGKLVRSNA
jgi:acyl-CoA synthetase (AMP-forming)/AMP-acid ligase II